MADKKDKTRDRSVAILEVFAHYRTYHPRSFPTPRPEQKEWIKIRLRLEEGYSVDDLIAAIDGCHRSPFHMGENDRAKRFDSLELIMRDGSKVQQFIEVPESSSPVLNEKTLRSMRARDNYLQRRCEDAEN